MVWNKNKLPVVAISTRSMMALSHYYVSCYRMPAYEHTLIDTDIRWW